LAGAFERAAAAIPSPLYIALATGSLAVATVAVVLCAAWTVRGWIRQLTKTAAIPAT
jgi:hypothetical protein